MDRKKIIQVVGVLNRGGAELMLLDIAKNISKKYKLIFLVNYKKNSIKEGVLDQDFLDLGCEIYYIETQWSNGLINYYRNFKNILKKIGGVDVIHIHINVKSGIISLYAKMFQIQKIIVHSHGEINYGYNDLKSIVLSAEFFVQRQIIRLFATDFWACSLKAGKTLFPNKIDKDIIVIKNAIDIHQYEKVKNSDIISIKKKFAKTDKLIIGSVGRIVKRKNLSFVIDILNEIKKSNVDFVFLNIGQVDDKEYYEKVIEKVNKYNLNNYVINLGLRDDIPKLMSALDVFISPAFNEAFGIVAIEAQAAGVKTILSNQFPSDVDLNLGLVKFIDNFDPIVWKNEILKNNSSIKIDKKIVRKAFDEKGFDIKKNINVIERLYES